MCTHVIIPEQFTAVERHGIQTPYGDGTCCLTPTRMEPAPFPDDPLPLKRLRKEPSLVSRLLYLGSADVAVFTGISMVERTQLYLRNPTITILVTMKLQVQL